MGWLTYRLGNGVWGTVDGDNPNTPPQVTINAQSPLTVNNLTVVNADNSPVLLLAANINRKFFTIYNNSNKTLWIKLGSGVSNDTFNVAIPANGYYESVTYIWVGEVWGVWQAPVGDAQVSELS